MDSEGTEHDVDYRNVAADMPPSEYVIANNDHLFPLADIPPQDIRRAEQALSGSLVDPPLNPTGSGWDPAVAHAAQSLPELPEEVQKAMEEGPSDIDLLYRKISDLENSLSAAQFENREALQYLCQNMGWLVNMLSGVAQVAQNMPGMGGMMSKLMGGGKNNG